ncbi:MAG: Undecaprenyl-phosphate galactosephosphotransferase [uncultured Chloroflexi bacterium]|uniref:Undecaprenyl-phosphate galactosephosphotransferase n=1 Tax=uncultured Chloroflexota bacterium TaxID=166587 RepID=A0A6J4KIQ0_9CHLR|nr:MAG: Undecaprenyl-phosphate galactosephosphotransferase [uncultured Chloroflexota bacterium]
MAEPRIVELPRQTAAETEPMLAPARQPDPGPQRTPRARRLLEFTLSPFFVACSDVLAIAAGFWLAYFVRFILEIPAAQEIHSARAYAGMLATATPIFLVSFTAYGLYERRNLSSIIDQLFRLGTAVLMGMVVTVAVSSFVVRGWPDYSRLLLGYLWVGCTLTACLGRYLWVLWRDYLAKSGAVVRTALVVGAGAAGQRVAMHFKCAPELGYRAIGFLDDTLPAGATIAGLPVVGRIGDLDAALARCRPNDLVLADPTLNDHELLEIVNRCEGQPVTVRVYPDIFQMLVTEASLVNLRGLQLLGLHATELQVWQRTLKRLFDVAFASAVLVLASPLFLLIALLVKMDSPGPVFYSQERVGQDGKRFHAIKFRSMVQDAETVTGRFWTVPGDSRRTRLGKWLRRFSLDELPQFVNVLVGDMSVVGPRPERPMFVAQFSELVPDYLRRLRVKAGLTGWAQVNGLRGDVSIEERTKYDLYYVDKWSLWLDIKIIFRTTVLVLRDPSAY